MITIVIEILELANFGYICTAKIESFDIFFLLCGEHLGIRHRSIFCQNLDNQTFKNVQIVSFIFPSSIELFSLLKSTKKQINIVPERLRVTTSIF